VKPCGHRPNGLAVSRGAFCALGGSSLGLVDTDVLRGSSLIVNGRSVTQGRVQTLIVVVPEIASELDAEFRLGLEPVVTMHEISLEGMKERFYVSVVTWRAAAGHALTNTQGSEARSRKAALAYSPPRSLWKIRPGRVRRRRIAASRTARVSEASRVGCFAWVCPSPEPGDNETTLAG
jgi:hypothetical protein